MYIHQKLCQLLANAHAAHQGHGASRGCRGRGQARTCWRPRSEMLQNCSDTLSSFLLPTMSFSTKLFRVPHTRTRAHGIKSQHKPTSQHKATSQRAAPSRDPSRRRMPHRACNPALHSDTISMRRAPSPTTSPTDPVRTPPPLDVSWRVLGSPRTIALTWPQLYHACIDLLSCCAACVHSVHHLFPVFDWGDLAGNGRGAMGDEQRMGHEQRMRHEPLACRIPPAAVLVPVT